MTGVDARFLGDDGLVHRGGLYLITLCGMSRISRRCRRLQVTCLLCIAKEVPR